MQFGKNRVQYQDFYWSYYRYERFDVYFNQFGKELAGFISKKAEEEIIRLENYFDYNLDNRIIFVVFNNLSEFRQSNIGLITGKDEYNIGGVTQISRNKVFLFYEGDHEKLTQQIRSAVAQVVISEMLYGFEFKDNVANSTLLDVPEWYLNGLISYLTSAWNYEVENRVKDGILNGKYEKLNQLYGEDAVMAGHSIWRYIAEAYGDQVIPNIVYLTRVNKKYSMGFLYSLGVDLKQVSNDWFTFYLEQFSDYPDNLKLPQGENVLKRTKKNVIYSQLKINPLGKYVAYVTNDMGKYKVWIYNEETGKRNKILKDGHKLEQIVDNTYPVLSWHPSGRILSFVTEEEGGMKLYFYTIYNKELNVKNLLYFEKILDFSYSPDGSKIVISGVRNGRTDIFVHTLASSTNEQITNDLADDFDPSFINNGNSIIFSSNRITNSVQFEESNEKVSQTFDLFIYKYKENSDQLLRLNEYDFSDELMPVEIKHNTFLSLTNESGIYNQQITEFDSTIAFIDTTIHYRYFSRTKPYSNYAYNIKEFDFNKGTNEIAEITYFDGRYNLKRRPFSVLNIPENNNFKTPYRLKQDKLLSKNDSVDNIKRDIIPITEIVDNVIIADGDTLMLDNGFIDVNNYIFEKEKINYYNDKVNKLNLGIALDTLKKENKIRIYQPTFYIDHLVNQVSFSFLNESYQVFSGEDAFYNPGFNLLQKVGTSDLFEDYKLMAGLGFTPNFTGVEYLLSFENLKYRTDHQFVYHRQKIVNAGEPPIKTISDHLFYVRRYPFSQVASFSTTVSLRLNQIVHLPIDNATLIEPNQLKAWSGLKLAYVFDNTRTLGTNLHEGLRIKIFGEAYKQFNAPYDDLYVLGADFRNYIKLHRVLILANRFAASTSFGKAPLVYFLGGVDNWLPINRFFRGNENFQQFIPFSEIPIDQNKGYAYRTLATNMRGFQQNIRNGNNFFVLNNEIRLPLFRYLANYPISSNFINNFQIVGFFDIGSAWTGLTPYSKKNTWDERVIDKESYTITVDTNRSPIIYGYGYGFRTQLLGYFIRLDFARGIENNVILPKIFYLSFNVDF